MNKRKIEEALDVLEIKLNLQVASLEQCLKEVLQSLSSTIRKELSKDNVSSIKKKNGLLVISDPEEDDILIEDKADDVIEVKEENDEAYESLEDHEKDPSKSSYNSKEEDFAVQDSFEVIKETKYVTDKPWKCKVCSFGARNKMILLGHVKKSHAGITKILNSFDAPTLLDSKKVQEIINKQGKDSKPKEVNSKKQKGQKTFPCNDCEYSPISRSKLVRHTKAVHEKRKDLRCSKCEYCTGRKDKLDQHIKESHGTAKQQDNTFAIKSENDLTLGESNFDI